MTRPLPPVVVMSPDPQIIMNLVLNPRMRSATIALPIRWRPDGMRAAAGLPGGNPPAPACPEGDECLTLKSATSVAACPSKPWRDLRPPFFFLLPPNHRAGAGSRAARGLGRGPWGRSRFTARRHPGFHLQTAPARPRRRARGTDRTTGALRIHGGRGERS